MSRPCVGGCHHGDGLGGAVDGEVDDVTLICSYCIRKVVAVA